MINYRLNDPNLIPDETGELELSFPNCLKNLNPDKHQK